MDDQLLEQSGRFVRKTIVIPDLRARSGGQMTPWGYQPGHLKATSNRHLAEAAPWNPAVPAPNSGTSTQIGPRFFAGRVAERRGGTERIKLGRNLRVLAWGASSLVVVAAFMGLESLRWLSASSGSRYEAFAFVEPILSVLSGAIPDNSLPTIAGAETPDHQPLLLASPSPSNVTERPRREVVPVRAIPVLHPQQRKPAYKEVQTDDVSARQSLLKRATANGDANAPVTLANMYLEGKEAPRNCDEALALLETAAAQSNVRARNRLAGLYATGSCVRRDRVQAYRWLRSALDTDPQNRWAQQNLDLTWQQMTEEERSALQAEAR